MRNKKFGLIWYQANDTAAMERKLEKMAEQGWLLEKVSNWGWHYRRAEPQQVKYAVTYFPDASVFDAGLTEGQQTYADYCAAAGWEFAGAYGPMQFFRSTRFNPTPIETDEAEKLQAIHKSMLKTLVLSHCLLLFSMLLQLSTRFGSIRMFPLDFVSNNLSLTLPLFLVIFGLYLAGILVDYFIWYIRSKKAVERGEACLQPHTRARLWAGHFLLAMVAVLLIVMVGEATSPGMGWLMVYAFGGMAMIMALCFLLINVMKKRGASRAATRGWFIAACLVLSIIYAGGTTKLVMDLNDSGLMKERQPAYVHTYTDESGDRTYEWDVYLDPIPLKMEDMGQPITAEDHSSYHAETARSLLAELTTYSQNPRSEENRWNYLEYSVAEIRWDWLREFCLEKLVAPRKIANGVYTNNYDLVEDPRWGAEAVYVRQKSSDNTQLVLAYSERIVTFSASWQLTDEQIAAAVEKLDLR